MAQAPVDRFEENPFQGEDLEFGRLLALAQGAQSQIRRPVGETAEVRLSGLEQLWQAGLRGKGQTIAIIDSGLFPHPDFEDRVVGWVDLASHKERLHDPWGHGTHVAGVMAGDGHSSEGKVMGVAPEANLVGVRVGSVEQAIAGLRWVVEHKEQYDITVVNVSLGDTATQSHQRDPWCRAVEEAVAAGLTVVVAAGNEGRRGARSIATPGISPSAITVGGVDDQGTPQPQDDSLYLEGSQGPTPFDALAKPDVMAPAVCIYSTLSPGSALDDRNKPHLGADYISLAGTSMATASVAGLVALLQQARPDLEPGELKTILQRSAYPGKLPIVQAEAAWQLAQEWPK